MTHYLVRHGHAEPGADDRQRPLSARGRAEAERVGRYLAGRGVPPATMRHSGLLRARQTAEILSAHWGAWGSLDEMAGLAPDDDPAAARAVLEATGQPLALVGHLPHLGHLVGALLAGPPDRDLVGLPPGTVVALARAEGHWMLEWALPPVLVGPEPPRA